MARPPPYDCLVAEGKQSQSRMSQATLSCQSYALHIFQHLKVLTLYVLGNGVYVDGAVHNLEEFITMSDEHVIFNPREAESSLMHQKFGILLDEEGFKQLFQ